MNDVPNHLLVWLWCRLAVPNGPTATHCGPCGVPGVCHGQSTNVDPASSSLFVWHGSIGQPPGHCGPTGGVLAIGDNVGWLSSGPFGVRCHQCGKSGVVPICVGATSGWWMGGPVTVRSQHYVPESDLPLDKVVVRFIRGPETLELYNTQAVEA